LLSVGVRRAREQTINGWLGPLLIRSVIGRYAHRVIGNLDVPIRRHNVHDSWFQALVVEDRAHRQSATPGENLAQMTETVGIEMLRQHERRGEIRGQRRDERRERLDATSRRTDNDQSIEAGLVPRWRHGMRPPA
jgi:hypothetical protein